MPQQVPLNLPPQRVIACIDGFNLYYGLKSQAWRRYYWLDVPALCAALLLQNGQQLAQTKYFTAHRFTARYAVAPKRIPGSPANAARPKNLLRPVFDQNAHLSGLRCHGQRFQREDDRCEHRRSDLERRVSRSIRHGAHYFRRQRFGAANSRGSAALSQKTCLGWFSAGRVSKELRTAASAYFSVGRGRIAGNQLPQTVTKADGTALACPARWR